MRRHVGELSTKNLSKIWSFNISNVNSKEIVLLLDIGVIDW